MTLLLARIVLAGLFVVAVSAKLAGLGRSMAALGFPLPLVAPLGWGLMASELVVAGLLCSPAPVAGGLGALLSLVAFDVVVVVNLRRERTPDCHCFGRLAGGPIGWSTMARNGCLMAVAGYVAADGRMPLAFAGILFASAALWGGLGPLSSHVPRRGRLAPDFSLADRDGATWTLRSVLASGFPALLVFSHPGCGACTVTEAAEILGISRAAAYEAVHHREIPSLRIGRRIVVPIRPLLRMLDEPSEWPTEREG